MNYSEIELNETEEEIKRYFGRSAEINRLKHRLGFLENKKIQVENDIKNSNIRLNVVMPRFSLDSEPVQNSGPAKSQQEKALDSAFIKLERQLEHLNDEIIYMNIDIRDLEYKNCDMEFILGQLDQTAKEFIKLYYEKKSGYTKISNILHLSIASVSRLRVKILCDIRSYYFYMKRK